MLLLLFIEKKYLFTESKCKKQKTLADPEHNKSVLVSQNSFISPNDIHISKQINRISTKNNIITRYYCSVLYSLSLDVQINERLRFKKKTLLRKECVFNFDRIHNIGNSKDLFDFILSETILIDETMTVQVERLVFFHFYTRLRTRG